MTDYTRWGPGWGCGLVDIDDAFAALITRRVSRLVLEVGIECVVKVGVGGGLEAFAALLTRRVSRLVLEVSIECDVKVGVVGVL